MGIACVLSTWRDTDQGIFAQLGTLRRNTSILLSSVGGVLGQENAFKADSSWGEAGTKNGLVQFASQAAYWLSAEELKQKVLIRSKTGEAV
ncbi:MAG TPA: hypothetical protein VKK81_28250 [Candidatus Binatia bacterium]|nr:hypothetical protein [Candidatus Binatia bacterium]